MTTAAILLLLCGAAVPAGVVAFTAGAHVRAAAGRRTRRNACPFEDDDDESRPPLQEVVAVVRESAAVLRVLAASLAPVPSAWRTGSVRPGRGPVIVLLAERPALAASMIPLGHRLARDLDASVHVEPRAAGGDVRSRAVAVVDRLSTMRTDARGRTVLLIGHGAGGLVARHAAGALRLAGLRVVTLATPHRASDEPEVRDPLVDRIEVVNVYSLHDAIVDPPARAYLPGAYNVALRDEGHFGLLLGARLHAILIENLADLAPHAAVS